MADFSYLLPAPARTVLFVADTGHEKGLCRFETSERFPGDFKGEYESMRILNKTIGTAVVAMMLMGTTASAVQAATPASKLSLQGTARAATADKDASQMRGGFVIPLFAIIAVILGIVLIANDDEEPHSP